MNQRKLGWGNDETCTFSGQHAGMPRSLLILQARVQALSDSAARAIGETPKLTACGCKRLGSRFSMLSQHPGRLLQLQTCIDYSGQSLRLSLRGFGRKVCNVFFSSHNRFSWCSQPASSLSCTVTCIGVSLALGAFSDFFSTAVLFPSIGRVSQPFNPSAMSSAFCSLVLA